MKRGSVDTASLTLAIALLILVAIIGGWDIWVAFGTAEGRSVSEILYTWGQRFPPVVLFLGLLLGHLFWPVRR